MATTVERTPEEKRQRELLVAARNNLAALRPMPNPCNPFEEEVDKIMAQIEKLLWY